MADSFDPVDSSVHGILQAKILEWIAFPFSRGSSQPRDQTQVPPALQADFLPAEPQGKLYRTLKENRLFWLTKCVFWC